MIADKKGYYVVRGDKPFTHVCVIDQKNDIIYARWFSPSVIEFGLNLPEGNFKFVTDSASKVIPISVEKLHCVTFPVMPEPDNHFAGKNSPMKVKVIAGFSGSPASTNLHKNEVEVNQKFMSLPFFKREFILAHEDAHNEYSSEYWADMKACKTICEKGGNIFPCLVALSTTLSTGPANALRIEKFLKTIQTLR